MELGIKDFWNRLNGLKLVSEPYLILLVMGILGTVFVYSAKLNGFDIWFINNPKYTYGPLFTSSLTFFILISMISAIKMVVPKVEDVEWSRPDDDVDEDVVDDLKQRLEAKDDRITALKKLGKGLCPLCGKAIDESKIVWSKDPIDWECDNCDT